MKLTAVRGPLGGERLEGVPDDESIEFAEKPDLRMLQAMVNGGMPFSEAVATVQGVILRERLRNMVAATPERARPTAPVDLAPAFDTFGPTQYPKPDPAEVPIVRKKGTSVAKEAGKLGGYTSGQTVDAALSRVRNGELAPGEPGFPMHGHGNGCYFYESQVRRYWELQRAWKASQPKKPRKAGPGAPKKTKVA